MDKEYSVISGTLDEFANAFNIKQDTHLSTLNIYFPSQQISYDEVRKFLRKSVTAKVLKNGEIIELSPSNHFPKLAK